jgi:PAS domain S-box-containing protein
MNNLFQAFDKAADGVLIINQDRDIIYWNRAAEDIVGYTHNEVAGLPCYQILKGSDNQGQLICHKYCRVAMTALNGGTVTNYDISIRTKLGDVRWINVSTFILPTNGAKGGWVLVHLFRDVTTKKQNEQFVDQVLAAAKQLESGEPSQVVPSESKKQHHTHLTDRELEVLTFLAQGSSTNDIALSLSISPATTRNHIRNILQKFQVHSRLEAVVYALEQKLITKD